MAVDGVLGNLNSYVRANSILVFLFSLFDVVNHLKIWINKLGKDQRQGQGQGLNHKDKNMDEDLTLKDKDKDFKNGP